MQSTNNEFYHLGSISQGLMYSDRPILLKNFINKNNPILGWDKSYLINSSDEELFKIAKNESYLHGPHQQNKILFEQMTLNDFIKNEDSFDTNLNKKTWLYLQDSLLKQKHLKSDFHLPDILPPNKILFIMLWIGGPHIVSRLHYDPYQNLILQVKGSKKYILFHPTKQNMHPFPTFSQAPFVSQLNAGHFESGSETYELSEGDALFIPAFWWHQVHSLNDYNLNVNIWWKYPHLKKMRYWKQFSRLLPLTLERKFRKRFPKRYNQDR